MFRSTLATFLAAYGLLAIALPVPALAGESGGFCNNDDTGDPKWSFTQDCCATNKVQGSDCRMFDDGTGNAANLIGRKCGCPGGDVGGKGGLNANGFDTCCRTWQGKQGKEVTGATLDNGDKWLD
ncbi:MAG: hypothetical protein M1831_000822 [Alyxoria varia]|nr:MAG: hypothetical protein M1831_000822 [Alyxoria varia]